MIVEQISYIVHRDGDTTNNISVYLSDQKFVYIFP